MDDPRDFSSLSMLLFKKRDTMEFFKITLSGDCNVIGHVDWQIEGYLDTEELWKGTDSIRNIPQEGPVQFVPNFPVIPMKSAAKKTDLLHNMYITDRTLLLSARAKDFLEPFNLDEHQWFDVEVRHLSLRMPYFCLYMLYFRSAAFINWPASRFVIIHRKVNDFEKGVKGKKVLDPIEISSYEEYLREIRSRREFDHAITAREIILVDGIPFDLFRMTAPISVGYYCSSRLKEAIETAELTGFKFIPLKNV